MLVEVRYGITFGKLDSTDWIPWDLELTEEEAVIYKDAIANKIPLEKVEGLKDALRRAYKDIEFEEIDNGLAEENEYVMECQGEAEMDPDDINDLIEHRDPHALAFFDLDEEDEDELDEWDAYDLEELPTINEFDKDFEPYSPFDEGWDLHVEFVDPNY